MYRVRAAHNECARRVLAKDPELAPLEISAAQYVNHQCAREVQVRGLRDAAL